MQRIPRRAKEPWSQNEVNRIMMAARTMPGFVGEIREREFWPALILLMLDIDISAPQAIQLPSNVLDMKTGRMPFGTSFINCMNDVRGVRGASSWTGEASPVEEFSREKSVKSLTSAYQSVLARAGLPSTDADLFSRLQLTGRRCPELIDANSTHS